MVGQHSSDYKLSAIKHYEQSDNLTEPCRVFHCYRKTLKLWYDKYKATGTLTRKNTEQGSYKVKKELVQYAIKRIRENPNIFIKDLKNYKFFFRREKGPRFFRPFFVALRFLRLPPTPTFSRTSFAVAFVGKFSSAS